MRKLLLRFDESFLELMETEFSHPLLPNSISTVRGKTSGAYLNLASFQWTASVRALCLLFVEAVLRADLPSNIEPLMKGKRGSLAASLDLALSKKPLWLLDMFGVDSQGESILRRMVRRTNSEMKRPGPVLLSLSPNVLAPSEIFFFIGTRRPARTQDLLRLREALSEQSGLIEEEDKYHEAVAY